MQAKILHSHLSMKEVCTVFEVLGQEVSGLYMGRNSMVGQKQQHWCTASQGRWRETGYGTEHQALYQHWPRKRIVHRQKAWWYALVVQVGITLAVLGRRVLQELKVKASRPCLGKLEVQGGWTLPRREAQGSTQIILFCRKRLKVGDH